MNKLELKNMIKLSSKVVVYVPATTGINKEIDNTTYVNDIATLLSQCFGGATASQALGMWLSPSAGLVKENTTMVFAFCKESDLQKHINKVIEKCEQLKKELSQDAIALEINGDMYFI